MENKSEPGAKSAAAIVGSQSDDYDDYDSDSGCYNCDGSGWIVTCIDDMCHGAGECMHGDGMSPCRVCNKNLDKDPC